MSSILDVIPLEMECGAARVSIDRVMIRASQHLAVGFVCANVNIFSPTTPDHVQTPRINKMTLRTFRRLNMSLYFLCPEDHFQSLLP